MKTKQLEALFEQQTHRKHLIKQDGDKPDEELKIGIVRYGVRMTHDEFASRFPAKPLPKNKTGGVYVVTQCSRQHLKLLKSHLFEKFSGAGFPIFQTKAWVKAREIEDDLATA